MMVPPYAARNEQIAGLQEEVRTLKAEGHEPGVKDAVAWKKDRGVWKAATTYEQDDLVNFQGSGWIARERNCVRPNDSELGHRAWRLAIKRGAYDKDTR
jgi:hypothetical protein